MLSLLLLGQAQDWINSPMIGSWGTAEGPFIELIQLLEDMRSSSAHEVLWPELIVEEPPELAQDRRNAIS